MSLEISQFSVGPVTAQQLELMESDATITPDDLSQKSEEEIFTASEDSGENLLDSADLFDPSTKNISPIPILHYQMDANWLRTLTVQCQLGLPHSLHLLLVKAVNRCI